MEPSTVSLFGYHISCRGMKGDIEMALKLISSSSYGNYMACANPHSLVVASRDRWFFQALREADILIPDGSGIVLAAHILKLPIKERVTGSDIFLGITKALSNRGGARYFFLGSTKISDTGYKDFFAKLNNLGSFDFYCSYEKDLSPIAPIDISITVKDEYDFYVEDYSVNFVFDSFVYQDVCLCIENG